MDKKQEAFFAAFGTLLTENWKSLIAWSLVVLITISVNIYFETDYPIPPPPTDPIVALGTSHMSGPLDITDAGTAALPNLTFEGDTDTGVWHDTADTLNISAGGVEQAEFDGTSITLVPNLEASADVSIGGDLSLTGALSAGGSNTLDIVIFEHTALTATTTTITPTHTFYSLDTAAAVTITLAASGVEGQLLILINDDANATIIADTNLASIDGNAITMTNADDMAILIYQDDKWHEIASPDGS